MATREVVEIIITQDGTKVVPEGRAVDLGIEVGGDIFDPEIVEAMIKAEKLGLALTIRRDANSISERI